MHFVI